ncbi:cyclic-phosphate processing receiver domain-containing protein [Sphingomonas sp. ZB1N12]|uniref:cyclic-phosphate processing receiver domain-containing protein n=1 Tax=Sphingomonas arabinosi TaxID=3096160 RepID=UPI003FA6A9EA
MRIFLDDDRSPPTWDWHVVRDATAFLAAIRLYRPTIIAFDHDLGSDGAGFTLPSGQHCMHLLIDEAMDRPAGFDQLRLVVPHSAYPVGRANMRRLLERAHRHDILPICSPCRLRVTSYPWEIT